MRCTQAKSKRRSNGQVVVDLEFRRGGYSEAGGQAAMRAVANSGNRDTTEDPGLGTDVSTAASSGPCSIDAERSGAEKNVFAAAEENVSVAAAVLQRGGVIALPTDTLYGSPVSRPSIYMQPVHPSF